ncbi:MAG: hypothetical protein KME54_18900 [Tolypothrix brevis GSE-NOS-MK-07-07A]|nr:hypothetical protein [Tolypothrix brevis GSE-NOS-MK-07-07A]
MKPSNVGQVLRVIREQYGKNPLIFIPGEECRFSTGPLGGSRQSIGVVENNGNTLRIISPTGFFIEQIQLLQFYPQQQLILVQKINTLNQWRRSPR